MNITKIHKAVFKKSLHNSKSIKYEQTFYNKFDLLMVSFKVVKQSYGLAKIKTINLIATFQGSNELDS